MERTSSVSYTVTRQAQLKIATSKENRMNTSRATLWKVLCSPLISAENAQRAFVSDTTKGLQTDMGLWLKEMLQSSSDGHDSASLCPLLSATSAPPPSPLHLIFLQHRFGVCRLRAQDLGSLRAKTLWQAEKWRAGVTGNPTWDLSPAVLTPQGHLWFFPTTKRDVSPTKGHRRATGTRTLYGGKVSCCFFNFLSGKWNIFQQKVGKDLEQNWSWLSKHLTTFCGKQPSVLGDINSRRYWWH